MPDPAAIQAGLGRFRVALDEARTEYAEFLTAATAFDWPRAEDARLRFGAFQEAAFDQYVAACRALQEGCGRGG